MKFIDIGRHTINLDLVTNVFFEDHEEGLHAHVYFTAVSSEAATSESRPQEAILKGKDAETLRDWMRRHALSIEPERHAENRDPLLLWIDRPD